MTRDDSNSNVVLALLALVLVWVGVYWWWPARGPAQPPAPLARVDVVPFGAQPPQVPPSPAPSPLPAPEAQPTVRVQGVVPPQFTEHVVQPGQTLATISQQYFGTPDHAGAIARANPLLSPPDITPGRVVRVPKDPANVQGQPAQREVPVARLPQRPDAPATPALEQEYTVVAGDSLAKIARKVLGDERRAAEIFELNRDRLSDPARIRIGQKLRMPPKDAPPAAAPAPSGDAR